MRWLVAVAMVVPLLAGCADTGQTDVRVEAFTATYTIPSVNDRPGFEAKLTFGDIVQYVDADGQVRAGYELQVDYGAAADRLCSGQSILGGDLQLRRYRWGNGWGEDGKCFAEQLDWSVPGDEWPLVPHFGVAASLFPPPWATRTANGFSFEGDQWVYDGLLAPKQVPWGSVVASRTAYESRGPLASIPNEPVIQVHQIPMPDVGMPGGQAPLLHTGVSLDDAIEYARANDASAAALLDAGGCVKNFRIWPYMTPAPLPSPVPILLQGEPEGRLTLGLTTQDEFRSFDLTYGRRAPDGERGFLSIEATQYALPEPLDCSLRGEAAALPELLMLAASIANEPISALHAGWWQHKEYQPEPALSVSAYFHSAGFEDGRLLIDASQGQLRTWDHMEPGRRIDP